MEEFRKAQPVSGYPIKLPIGLKKLKTYDKPEVIQAFADILGSLMQPTDRSPVDHLKAHLIHDDQHAHHEPRKPYDESKAGGE